MRAELAELVRWAPLHMSSIDAARDAWPDATHVACFDTAFHHTLPEEARRLPLPEQVDRLGLRRYGFHGLSLQSIVDATHNLGRAVIAHLGSGCSVTAVHDGHSVHTSMSLTPTGGVMSATRSGDLDPEIPLLLLDQPDATAGTVRDLLDRHSGLAGIAHGLHDIRDLLAVRDHDQTRTATSRCGYSPGTLRWQSPPRPPGCPAGTLWCSPAVSASTPPW